MSKIANIILLYLAIAAKEKGSATLIRAVYNIGISYDGLGVMQEAIHCIHTDQHYYDKRKIMPRPAIGGNEFLLLFHNAKQYAQAIRYGKEAMLLCKNTDLKKMPTPCQNLAVVNQCLKQYSSALPRLKKALDQKYHR